MDRRDILRVLALEGSGVFHPSLVSRRVGVRGQVGSQGNGQRIQEPSLTGPKENAVDRI